MSSGDLSGWKSMCSISQNILHTDQHSLHLQGSLLESAVDGKVAWNRNDWGVNSFSLSVFGLLRLELFFSLFCVKVPKIREILVLIRGYECILRTCAWFVPIDSLAFYAMENPNICFSLVCQYGEDNASGIPRNGRVTSITHARTAI